MQFRERVYVFVTVCLMVSVPVCAFGQVTGLSPDEILAAETNLSAQRIRLRPPRFWQPVTSEGARLSAWMGPGEGGVFPRIQISAHEGRLDVIEQRALLRSRVQVRLIERGAEDVQLLDEVRVDDFRRRVVLQQVYSFAGRPRPMSALAWHFSGPAFNYTFLYTHSTEAFDNRLPTIEAVMDSIAIDGEEPSHFWPIVALLLVVSAAGWGLWRWFQGSKRKALSWASVPELDTLKAQDEAKGGGILVFGDDDPYDTSFDEDAGFKVLDLSKRPQGEHDDFS